MVRCCACALPACAFRLQARSHPAALDHRPLPRLRLRPPRHARPLPGVRGRAWEGVTVLPCRPRRQNTDEARVSMRALSIRQPFAELILRGVKTVEYRSRRTRVVGERFWIYASKGKGKR